MTSVGLIICYLVLLGAAVRRFWIALCAQRTARARARGPLRFDGDATLMIPIRNEPAMARTATLWWSERASVEPWFIVTEAEKPPRTAQALRAAGAKRVIVTTGRTKAEMLTQALGKFPDDVSRLWIFDSDSRPVGDFTCRSSVGLAPSIYVPDQTTGERSFSIWAGIALWQSVWSYGFEARMPESRKLWYLVGHGVSFGRKPLVDFDRMQRCEDLALGYKLSTNQIEVSLVGGSDVALWPTRVSAHLNQIARWFIGDLQAVASQRPFRLRHALRLLELAAGWCLGMPLCVACWLYARSWYPGWADAALGFVLLSLLAPVIFVPSLRPVRATSGVGIMIGLLLRPFLDCLACFIGVLKLTMGAAPVSDRPVTVKGNDAAKADASA